LTDAIADAGLCGNADTFLSGANVQCVSCIQTSFCCNSDLACTDTAGCTTVLACVEACATPGAAACLASCSTSSTLQATTAYLDFASCIEATCSASCPVLPLSVLGDH
jgi:hypothetical protein